MGLLGGVLGVLGLFAPANGVTFSFKAVKKNGVVIPTTSNLIAAPNDTIEVNMFASGWNADLPNSKLKTYQVSVNARKGYYNNGGPGFILPKGWNASRDLFMCDTVLECQDLTPHAPTCDQGHFCSLVCTRDGAPGSPDADCQAAEAAYPVCNDFSQCEGPYVNGSPTHNPAMGAFITEARTDWVFFGQTAIPGVYTRSLDYFYGAAAFNGALDPNMEKYLGTLILVVSPTACGTYSVDALRDIAGTFAELVIGEEQPQQFAPIISPLTINLGGHCGACCESDGTCEVTTAAACDAAVDTIYKGDGTVCGPTTCTVCPTVVSSNPPNCAIDARLPNFTNSAEKKGFTSVDITFSAPLPVPPAIGNFTVVVTPDQAGANPVITGVIAQPSPPAAPNTFRLTLDPTRPVPQRAWSCFRYTGCDPGPRVCLGALPIDVDQSRLTALPDLTALMNGLNADQVGVNPLKDFQCDLDRSGVCTTADIVTWVDMAVGATTFLPVLLDKEINIACPSATP